MTIDLSLLPAPAVIRPVDYEALLAARKDRLISLHPADQRPAVQATLALESESMAIVLQEGAYESMTLRAYVNDASEANMLAYAKGSDLDNLAALLGVQRLLVDPGNPTAIPPVPPTYESDERLRQRAQMAMEGTTVAGSYGAYIFHALSASSRVKDVAVDSPAPGDVRVTVLAADNDGEADAELLETVDQYLSPAERRPLNDTVLVEPATLVNFVVEATVHLYPGPSSAPVMLAAGAALESYLAGAARIGYDITRSGLFAALHRPGVRMVELVSPASDVLIGPREAARCMAINLAEGIRDV